MQKIHAPEKRRRTGLALVVAVALACLALVAGPAYADQSHLNIRVEMSSDLRVSVNGSLTDGRGKAIKRAPVRAILAGQNVGSAQTRGNGGFSMEFAVPDNLRGGNRQLVVRFDGSGKHSAAEAGVMLAMGSVSAPKPRDGDPRAPRPPRDDDDGEEEPPANSQQPPPPDNSAPRALALQVNPDTTEPVNGAVVTLNGSLKNPDGGGIAGAEIVVIGPAGEVEESYTLTNDSGNFQTFYEVPVDAAEAHPITVRFPGGGGFAPAEAKLDLNVRVVEASESESPTPEPTETTTPESAADKEIEPGLPAGATDEPSTEAVVDDGSPILRWMGGALFIVGGVAVITAAGVGIGLVQRKKVRDATGAGGGGLGIFEDDGDVPASQEPAVSEPDPEPQRPRRAAL